MLEKLGIVKEKVNIGRQSEVDIVKCIAIFLMVIIHLFDNVYDGPEGPLYGLIYTISDNFFCASVFMCCLGTGIVYSRNNSPQKLFLRGINLLLCGLALNIFRDCLLHIIEFFVTGERVFLVYDILSITNDILEFSAMAYLLTAFLKLLKLKNYHILIISVIMTFVGQLLIGVQTGYYIIDNFIGYIWGTRTESYFPLCYWYIYVAAGLVFGEYLQRVNDKKKFYKFLIPFGFAGTIMLLLRSYYLAPEPFIYFRREASFAWVHPSNSIPLCFVYCAWCGIWYFISGGKEIKSVKDISTNVTIIYVIHWIFISIFLLFCELEILPYLKLDILVIISGFILFIISAHLASLYRLHIKDKLDAFTSKHAIPLGAIIVITTLTLAISAVIIHNTEFPDTEYPNFLNDYDVES